MKNARAEHANLLLLLTNMPHIFVPFSLPSRVSLLSRETCCFPLTQMLNLSLRMEESPDLFIFCKYQTEH